MAQINIKPNEDKAITRIFVAEDGSWGDAEGLEVLELTQEQLAELNQLSENEQLDYLGKLPTKQSFLWFGRDYRGLDYMRTPEHDISLSEEARLRGAH